MDLVDPTINIWQQNVNKSPICQHNIVSSKSLIDLGASIVALQEPIINHFGKMIATRDWMPVYPSTHGTHPEQTRSVILIKAALTSNSWQQIDCPLGNITVIQLIDNWGKLTIFNIYNNGQHNQTLNLLSNFHHRNTHLFEENTVGTTHCIWLGDFNRHHPH